jgi:hypothetical protein
MKTMTVSMILTSLRIAGAGIPAVAAVLTNTDRGFQRFGKVQSMAVWGITPPEDAFANQREKQQGWCAP